MRPVVGPSAACTRRGRAFRGAARPESAFPGRPDVVGGVLLGQFDHSPAHPPFSGPPAGGIESAGLSGTTVVPWKQCITRAAWRTRTVGSTSGRGALRLRRRRRSSPRYSGGSVLTTRIRTAWLPALDRRRARNLVLGRSPNLRAPKCRICGLLSLMTGHGEAVAPQSRQGRCPGPLRRTKPWPRSLPKAPRSRTSPPRWAARSERFAHGPDGCSPRTTPACPPDARAGLAAGPAAARVRLARRARPAPPHPERRRSVDLGGEHAPDREHPRRSDLGPDRRRAWAHPRGRRGPGRAPGHSPARQLAP